MGGKFTLAYSSYTLKKKKKSADWIACDYQYLTAGQVQDGTTFRITAMEIAAKMYHTQQMAMAYFATVLLEN